MGFLAFIIIYFFGIGVFVFLINLMILLCFDRVNKVILTFTSMFVGFLYTIIREIFELWIFAVLFVGIHALFAIGVATLIKKRHINKNSSL
ncbi:hypothetical protein [Aquibacillus kalidii]|uniref:hypothetical protein n=1 Tax=Aquibacillus kalidii TaxID=2762597 RepID=UPI0016467C77|nr:hypothetical protein [Aquibacillus kalidii]